jgi:hypothetical protein
VADEACFQQVHVRILLPHVHHTPSCMKPSPNASSDR